MENFFILETDPLTEIKKSKTNYFLFFLKAKKLDLLSLP